MVSVAFYPDWRYGMNEEWTVGYNEGYQAGWNAAMDAKPARESLTDDEIQTAFIKCGGKWDGDRWVIEDADFYPFARTIEHPELSTLRAISDEYNAWIRHHAAGHSYDDFLANRAAFAKAAGDTA